MAVRLGSNSNTVERLVRQDYKIKALAFTKVGVCVISQGNFIPDIIEQGRSFYLEALFKTGDGKFELKTEKIKCLPSLGKSDLANWFFWPVPGTNLWVAVNSTSNHIAEIVESGGKEVNLEFYLFIPDQIIRQKRLKTFVPDKYNNGYPDFRFDPLYRQIIYKTRDGYETYDIWKNNIVPSDVPAGEPAIPVKNCGKGFDWPLRPD